MGEISVEDVQYQIPAQVFAQIADTANFIVLVPVAENFNMIVSTMRAWNSEAGVAGISPNAGVDDFGFIDAMLDEVIIGHNVNTDRIYVCGFSMGGFMTQRFALQHNHRFAAYASVSGTIGENISSTTPNRPIRLAHFHGTSDETVQYEDNTFGTNVEDMLNFWIENNQCDSSPIFEDHYTDNEYGTNTPIEVDYYVYSNGDADIEFHKQNGAGHVWLKKTSQEIWKFFNKHEGILDVEDSFPSTYINIYPNPAVDYLNFSFAQEEISEISIIDINGRTVFNKQLFTKNKTISLKENKIGSGLYFIINSNSSSKITNKLIVE